MQGAQDGFALPDSARCSQLHEFRGLDGSVMLPPPCSDRLGVQACRSSMQQVTAGPRGARDGYPEADGTTYQVPAGVGVLGRTFYPATKIE